MKIFGDNTDVRPPRDEEVWRGGGVGSGGGGRNSTDTGERQEMFGYKARHIKTTMMMESTPDACNQSHMKMEADGWYADLSAGFSCSDESYRSLACGGGKRGCADRIRQESLTTADADSTTRKPPDSTALSKIATRSAPAR